MNAHRVMLLIGMGTALLADDGGDPATGMSRLLEAVRAGDLDRVRALIERPRARGHRGTEDVQPQRHRDTEI